MPYTSNVKGIKAKRSVHAVCHNGRMFKMFQTMFLNDGSLVVNFPYLRDQSGFLTEATMPAGQYPIEKINIGASGQGYCTSHAVKYTHHMDGRAHFSQDGKILTKVKRQSSILESIDGHIFTLKMQHPNGFKVRTEKDITKLPERAIVEYRLPTATDAVQFTGWIKSRQKFAQGLIRQNSPVSGPFVDLVVSSKRIASGIIFDWFNASDDLILVVAGERIEPFDSNRDAAFVFTGGFDDAAIVHDHTRPSSFLFLGCPHPILDDLSHPLIDLRPTR